MAKHFVANVTDIPEGKGRTVRVAGKQYLVMRIDGAFKAFRNFCPHMGGALTFGGGAIICQMHGACFNPRTGIATKGPAVNGAPLTPLELTLDEGGLYCEIEDDAPSPWANQF